MSLNPGSFDDFKSVAEALKGAYGAWVNTDSFTVGEAGEVWAGIRIFELAKQTKSMRHYVYSNLENALRVRIACISSVTRLTVLPIGDEL